MIFCTAVCANHLAKAITMAKSLKKHMPDSTLIVCLVEMEMVKEAESCRYFDEVILAGSLEIPDFFSFMFRHSIYEAACAIKAQLLLNTMQKYPQEQKFAYIDSDVKIYSAFTELDEVLEQHSIVVTPHHLEPMEHVSEIVRIEENQLRVGSFNMGFLAVSQSDNASRFLKWWNERLYHFCYIDPAQGLFLDQKWMDLAPGLFDVYILKHPGYNIGNWNIPTRRLYLESGIQKVNGHELRFIHYSGVGSWFDQYLHEFVKDKDNLLYALYDEYKRDLKKAGNGDYEHRVWSFDYFWNGEKILPETRKLYRSFAAFNDQYPFHLSNALIKHKR